MEEIQKMRILLVSLICSILWAGPVLSQPFAYITNEGGNNVTIIDTANNTLVGAPINTQNFPQGVTISPDGSRVYAANGGSASISVIDTSTNAVITTVSVGPGPGGMAVTPDGSLVYVAIQSANNVIMIDTSTNTVVGSPITVGNAPTGLAVNPEGSFVYVTNLSSSTISVIDTSSNTVTDTIMTGPGPTGVAVSPDGGRVYTANIPGSVSVVDTSTNMVIDTVAVGVQPRGVAVTPDGNFVYISNSASGTVSVIRTSDNMVIKTVTVQGLPQGVDVTPDGDHVYVANQGPGTISVIRTSDNTVIDTISVGNVSWGPSAFGNFIGPSPVTLDIALSGSGVGNVSAMDIDCGDGGVDCMETYHIIGTDVELTATPDANSFFSGWSGSNGCTGSNPILTITMDTSKTCTASFTEDPSITVNKVGDGDGTVTSSPMGIDCGPTCMAEFTELSTVELTAVPDVVSAFTGFSGDPDCADGMLTMDRSKSCTATFEFLPLLLYPIFPGVASNANSITVEQTSPEARVAFVWGFVSGSTIIGGSTCNGLVIDIKPARLIGFVTSGVDQIAEIIVYIPFNPAFRMPVLVQAIDIQTCRTSEVTTNIIINE